MNKKRENLYKVKATIMIPLDVEFLVYEDTPKDAQITVACLSPENRYDESIQLDKDMYASYEIEPLQQVLENVEDLDWTANPFGRDTKEEPVKACCLCYEPLEVMKDENGEVTWDDGNDALPLADGRCCNACDFKVTVARLAKLEEARG
jgi:hypothetical protein